MEGVDGWVGVEAMLLLLLPARRLAADSAYASMGAVGLRIRLPNAVSTRSSVMPMLMTMSKGW